MKKKPESHLYITAKAWLRRHIVALVVLISLFFVSLLIHFFGWWETLGILFLKFGLGAKVAGAKTFAHAVIKAGGKKAIAVATAGMLAKRHIIDILSKFFTEHSLDRYKNNILLVLKQKLNEIRESTLAKKIRALGSMLLSIPMVYIFWTKVLGAALQKFVYALILPLVTLLWNLIISSFNFISFVFQVFMLNLFLDTISRYRIGQKIIALIETLISIIGKMLNIFNALLEYIGLNPKAQLIKLSNRFNKWLESILDKGLSPVGRLENKRARYINGVEKISEKRYITAQTKRDKKSSQWIYIKKLYDKKVLKKRDWRANRTQKIEHLQSQHENSASSIRKRVLEKRKKRYALILPYHISER